MRFKPSAPSQQPASPTQSFRFKPATPTAPKLSASDLFEPSAYAAGRRATAQNPYLVAGGLGATGGTLKTVGAAGQLATGGRIGSDTARAGEKVVKAGEDISPVAATVGEFVAPVAGAKKIATALKVGEKGLSLAQRVLRGTAAGGATVSLAVPVMNADEMSVGQFYGEKGVQATLGALGGAGLVGVSAVGGATAKKLIDILGNRTIREARELITRYQGKTVDELERAVKQEQRAAAGARAAGEQVRAGAATREARAKANAPAAVPPEREKVLAATRERERAAQAGLERAQREEVAVADAVSNLRTRLAAGQPQERENFGGLIRDIASRIRNEGKSARVADAKFRQVVMESPAEPIVPTVRARNMIEGWMRDINNPLEERVMRDLHKRLSGDTGSINVRSADSLKAYINSILETKTYEGSPVDKALRKKVLDLKKTLLDDLYDSYEPYRVAMEAYRPASRALDIVERKGALKPVLDADPLNAQYRLTESQVVGEVIRRAKAGDQVFSRLLQENIAARAQKPELPDIQESARLYFIRELFERQQSPTTAVFKSWLRQNEQMLRQLNIYDEFATLNEAQRTAQRAVAVARGAVEEASSLRRAAVRQVEAAARTARKPEELAAAATSRAEGAAKRLAKQETRATKAATGLRDIELEMRTAQPEKVASVARRGIDRLRDTRKLNDAQYEKALADLRTIENATDQARRAENIRNWFYATLVPLGAAAVLFRGGPATEPAPVGSR